jgi:hypothetical protein
MAATQNALNYLVLAQLARLQKDQCRLESLYAKLPTGSEPKVEERFLALWKDVDERAVRLERMLDELAPSRTVQMLAVRRMPVQAANPSYRPAA